MCTPFSAWQRISTNNRDPELVKKEYTRSMVRIPFRLEVYVSQASSESFLLRGHSAPASSLEEDAFTKVAGQATVSLAIGDQL